MKKMVSYPVFVLALASACSFFSGAAHATVTDSGDGEIRKVDASSRRVIVSHGNWAGGNMSAMTMAMQVKEGVDLLVLRKGDWVRFEVVKEGRDWVITRVNPGKP